MAEIRRRLAKLEGVAMRQLGGADARAEWRELRDLFTADADNAAFFDTVAAQNGTRNLRTLLLQGGGIGGRLGRFCQDRRLACPESTLIKMRRIIGRDGAKIVKSGDESGAAFLQIWECGK